jgi:hypothetical protein
MQGRRNSNSGTTKIMSAASAVGMQMFSGAKNAFAFGKQKIATMSGSTERVDHWRSKTKGYKDESDSDDSDDNWYVGFD